MKPAEQASVGGPGESDSSLPGAILPLVYDELRALALAYLDRERIGHTLQPTALVHEAFVKLVDQPNPGWRNPTHFKALAATAMRQVLVDYARRHKSQKRGGPRKRIPLDSSIISLTHGDIDLHDLEQALRKLATLDLRQSRVVELRFFGGMSIEEAAEALGVSASTVANDWTFARAWLTRELATVEQS